MMTLMLIFGVATGLLLLIVAVSRSSRRDARSADAHGDSSYMFVSSGAEFSDSSGCSDGSSGADGGGCGDGGGGGGD